MTIKPGKPDLYTVLIRRNVKLKDYLSKYRILNEDTLNYHLERQSKYYQISSKFIEDAKKEIKTSKSVLRPPAYPPQNAIKSEPEHSGSVSSNSSKKTTSRSSKKKGRSSSVTGSYK